LGLAVAERPILFLHFDEVEQYVFAPKLQVLVKSVRHRLVKITLSVERAAGI
jgi:hypothetical protein